MQVVTGSKVTLKLPVQIRLTATNSAENKTKISKDPFKLRKKYFENLQYFLNIYEV